MAVADGKAIHDLLPVVLERESAFLHCGQIRRVFFTPPGAFRPLGSFRTLRRHVGRIVLPAGLHGRIAFDHGGNGSGDTEQVGTGLQRHFLHGLAIELGVVAGERLANTCLELAKALAVDVINAGQAQRFDGLSRGTFDEPQQVALAW
jgi:hypothetical protein